MLESSVERLYAWLMPLSTSVRTFMSFGENAIELTAPRRTERTTSLFSETRGDEDTIDL